MKRLAAALAACLVPMAAAHSALISAGSALGPDTVVQDTDSGLEWLKLSVTANLSIVQVDAELLPTGRFAGFHYASQQELLCSLIAPRLDIGCEPGILGSNRLEAAQSIVALFGGTGGYYAVDPPERAPERFGSTLGIFLFPDDPGFTVELDTQRDFLSPTRLNQPAATWLVRPAQPVPGPGSLALVGLGVLLLARYRPSRATIASQSAARIWSIQSLCPASGSSRYSAAG